MSSDLKSSPNSTCDERSGWREREIQLSHFVVRRGQEAHDTLQKDDDLHDDFGPLSTTLDVSRSSERTCEPCSGLLPTEGGTLKHSLSVTCRAHQWPDTTGLAATASASTSAWHAAGLTSPSPSPSRHHHRHQPSRLYFAWHQRPEREWERKSTNEWKRSKCKVPPKEGPSLEGPDESCHQSYPCHLTMARSNIYLWSHSPQRDYCYHQHHRHHQYHKYQYWMVTAAAPAARTTSAARYIHFAKQQYKLSLVGHQRPYFQVHCNPCPYDEQTRATRGDTEWNIVRRWPWKVRGPTSPEVAATGGQLDRSNHHRVKWVREAFV